MSAWVLISLAVTLALLVAGWVLFVDWRYALVEDRPTRLEVVTADGWTLALWHRPAARRRFEVPVILCHGFANNAAFMEFRGARSLGRAVAAAGFDSYAVDLRGAGASRPPHEGPWEVSFDDHVTLDVPAVVAAVQRHAGAARVAWVGHSLGGLVALAAGPALGEVLAALVTVGSPAFFRFPPSLLRLTRLASRLTPWGAFPVGPLRLIAPFAGRAPPPKVTMTSANLRNLNREDQRHLVANVFAPLWGGVLRQLADWLAHDVFRSADGRVDYRAGLAALQAPVLVVGGTVDLLAPPDVQRALFSLLTSPARTLALFGRTYGHTAEYGHGDLVVGKASPTEVYPVILGFLEAQLAPAAAVSASRSGSAAAAGSSPAGAP